MTSEPDDEIPTRERDPQRLIQLAQLTRIIDKLAYDFDAFFNRDVVQQLFDESYAMLAKSARVTTYLPVLADRLARERLRARAQVDGLILKKVPEVLFVCVQNAGRSQMAAALARHYAGANLHIRTGGSNPGEAIHPEVAQAMKQIGLSLDEEFPKPLTNDVIAAADIVVTMGCGDACPVLPGRRYEDWPINDPAGAAEDQVAAIRDDIDHRVRELIASVLPNVVLPDN
jgi:arsenate reductase (thioredoxin)